VARLNQVNLPYAITCDLDPNNKKVVDLRVWYVILLKTKKKTEKSIENKSKVYNEADIYVARLNQVNLPYAITCDLDLLLQGQIIYNWKIFFFLFLDMLLRVRRSSPPLKLTATREKVMSKI
jgi:hypothetical protein